MAKQSLEPKSVLGMTLDPTGSMKEGKAISVCWHIRKTKKDSLDGVSSPARTGGNCTVRVNLGVLVEYKLPSFDHVHEGLASPVFPDGVGKLCATRSHTSENMKDGSSSEIYSSP